MAILVDWQIRERALAGMIEPYEPEQVREVNGEKVISYGQSSMGYDIRLASEFKLIRPRYQERIVIDPKNFPADIVIDRQEGSCIIPGNSFILGRSFEYFKMPEDLMGICLGKSTLARCGIIVNTTPIEAGWEGYITIEISNTAPLPAKLYANEGIAQVIFFAAEEQCEVSYADKRGKYQKQKEITLPKV